MTKSPDIAAEAGDPGAAELRRRARALAAARAEDTAVTVAAQRAREAAAEVAILKRARTVVATPAGMALGHRVLEERLPVPADPDRRAREEERAKAKQAGRKRGGSKS